MTDGVTQTFAYSLTGVDPACSSGPGSAANSCGVHIHSGRTCTANAGGHYFTGTVTVDPWTSVAYTSASDGTASGIAHVTTGGTGADIEGRALIIHNFAGARVACALRTIVKVLRSRLTPDALSHFAPPNTHTVFCHRTSTV